MERYSRAVRTMAVSCCLASVAFAQQPAWAAGKYLLTDLGAANFNPHGAVLNILNQVAFTGADGVGRLSWYGLTRSLTNPYGGGSVPYAINFKGEVAGLLDLAPIPGESDPFLYSNGVVQDLSPTPNNQGVGFALSLNDRSQVTGQLDFATAFLYSNGSLISSLPNPGGTFEYTGVAINNAGQILIGAIDPDHHIAQTYVYANGASMPIAAPGGGINGVRGTALNARGSVTGTIPGTFQFHGFLYANGTTVDLGTLPGGNYTNGMAINDRNQVTGEANNASSATYEDGDAFLYSNGVLTDLGTLGGQFSQGDAINLQGDITGWSLISSGAQHAFVYKSGHMLDLNAQLLPTSLTSHVTLSKGDAINDLGAIAAEGTDNRTGVTHAYLLTPIP